MRRAVFLLAPLVTAGLLFACEDESGSSSGGSFGFEAGPGFDGGTPPGQDGAAPDAPEDAKPAAASVAVTKADGSPAVSIPVVVHDANGAVVSLLATGADGKLTIDPPPPMVSVLLSNGRTKHVVTWLGVQPGDVLNARDLAPYNPTTGSYTVTFGLPPVAQEDYRANVGDCAGYLFQRTPAPISVPMYSACAKPGNVNAVLLRGRTQNADQYFAFKKGNPPPPADGGTVDVAVGPWSAFQTVDVSATNPPASASLVGGLDEIAGAQVFANDPTPMDIVKPATFRVGPGFADAHQAYVRATLGTSSFLTIAKRSAPAATANIDLSQALPAITGATLDRKEFKRPKIAWTAAASLASTDGGSVVIEWSKPNEDARGWTFIVPPTATSLQAPALPATVDDWAPPDPDGGGFASFVSEPSVVFVETNILATPAAFRSQAALVLDPTRYYDRLRGAALPANGDTLRATEYRSTIAR
jgi:hypothetical protein